MQPPAVSALGDAALVVTFGDELSDAVNDRVITLAASLAAAPLSPHVRDVVPALASLVVHVDPRHAGLAQLMEELRARCADVPATSHAGTSRSSFVHEIPVTYDGPDLADVAAFGAVSTDDVVRIHAAGVYRVYMLGFLPGFAYLGLVDRSIAAPRRPVPRQHVPAGSIGIAGFQTGIYPQDSPGGWQIIGRTSRRMFERATGTSLLQPGDRVRFVPERAP